MDNIHELLVEEIKSATASVMGTMLGLAAEPGAPSSAAVEVGPADGVAALVGMAGHYTGTGTVFCSTELACKLAGAMLMSEFGEVCPDVLDAMGEIANMVIGNIKTNLEERFGPIGLSTPTVIHGHNFSTRATGNHTWTVVPFACEGDELLVQMMLVDSSHAHGTHAMRPHAHVHA